jgi:hypothetical protein
MEIYKALGDPVAIFASEWRASSDVTLLRTSPLSGVQMSNVFAISPKITIFALSSSNEFTSE